MPPHECLGELLRLSPEDSRFRRRRRRGGLTQRCVAGIAAFTGNLTLNNVGGWLLEATGVGRLSLSAATLINEMYCRRVLPVI